MAESSDNGGAIKPFDTYKYQPPTKETIMRTALAPGVFSAKCRHCKRLVTGYSVEELNKHKCPTP